MKFALLAAFTVISSGILMPSVPDAWSCSPPTGSDGEVKGSLPFGMMYRQDQSCLTDKEVQEHPERVFVRSNSAVTKAIDCLLKYGIVIGYPEGTNSPYMRRTNVAYSILKVLATKDLPWNPRAGGYSCAGGGTQAFWDKADARRAMGILIEEFGPELRAQAITVRAAQLLMNAHSSEGATSPGHWAFHGIQEMHYNLILIGGN